MHFSIPYTEDFADGAGNTYLGYNIHINGLFHCTVRYKQLYSLHEQLIKDFKVQLPAFPPKKLFPLTINQQEERRVSLEKYIQTVGQNSALNNSELLNGFLLNAQRETVGGAFENEDLDVFLMNGSKVTLNIPIGEHSGQVLKKICDHIQLPNRYVSYFALFIMSSEEDGAMNVLRRLQCFECPIITKKTLRSANTRVVLRKSYWDIEYDFELMHDTVALNLLYIQTAAEINKGWILVTDEFRDRLDSLRDRDDKKEYLRIARELKYYGYIQFARCICDYPQPNIQALVTIGRNELNLRVSDAGEEESEAVFKVTRMRCWRIATLHNGSDKCEDDSECSLELSFEYLMARDQLQWITISSQQAILMSVCLQAMIDELVLKKVGGSNTQEVSGKSWIYVMRDGHNRIMMGSSSNDDTDQTKKDNEINFTKPEPIIRKFTERLSAVAAKKHDIKVTASKTERKRVNSHSSTENNAFHMIGDDDL